MSAEENKAAQRRIIEDVINGKNLDAADELFSEEHRLYPESSGIGRGPEGMKQAFAGLHGEFPDVRAEIEDILAEGDTVAIRLTFRGTHAPTGEKAAWPETVFARFSGARRWRAGSLRTRGAAGAAPWEGPPLPTTPRTGVRQGESPEP